MRGKFVDSAKKGFIISKWTLFFSAGYGLAHGAAHWGDGVEVATAVGFVDFFSIAIGTWAAFNLYVLGTRAYKAWIEAMCKRIDSIKSQLLQVIQEPDVADDQRPPIVAHLVGYSFLPTLIFLAIAINSVLQAALWAQVDYPGSEARLILAAIALIFLASTISFQCMYFLYTHWRIAVLEQRAHRIVAAIQSSKRLSEPESRRVDLLDGGIALSTRLGHRFVGQSLAPAS